MADNFFEVMPDIFVGHPQKADAEFLFQDLLPVCIASLDAFDLVDAAIHFDRELGRMAVEVQPERTNAVLTPKMQAAAAVVPQLFP